MEASSSVNALAKLAKLWSPAELVFILGTFLAIVSLTPIVRDSFLAIIVLSLGVALALVGAAVVLWKYLQETRFQTTSLRQRNVRELEFVKDQLELLESRTSNIVNFTSEERRSIVDKVTERLSENAVDQIASKWADEFQAKAENRRRDDVFYTTAQDLVQRLEQEISALGGRANVNLVIGILISALGLAVPTWFVIESAHELSTGLQAQDAALRFVIRLTLAIFIQVFAYFFLRLYRYSIFEIKYFQNEITGAQFKLLALVSALNANDQKMIEKLCLELAKTERNFILKKGEKTLSVYREEIERDYENRLFAMIEKVAGIKTRQQ